MERDKIVRVPVVDIGNIEANIALLEGLISFKFRSPGRYAIPDYETIWKTLLNTIQIYKEIKGATENARQQRLLPRTIMSDRTTT